MKISVLIAAHNSAAHIEVALASVHAQIHVNWELLVVEYGVADETRALVQGFAARAGRPAMHLGLGENHGVASARNRLLELATGDWAAFLDPRDDWAPDHLANALRLIAAFDIVASDVQVGRGTAPFATITPSPQLAGNAVRTLFATDALPCVSAITFRRALAAKAGAFDAHFAGDEMRDFWLRCALAGARFTATHRKTCRAHEPDPEDLAQRHAKVERTLKFYEKNRELPAVPAALRRRMLASSLIAKGRLIRSSDPASAAQCFLRAWALQPMHIQTLGQLALIGSAPRVMPTAPPEPTEAASWDDESARPL